MIALGVVPLDSARGLVKAHILLGRMATRGKDSTAFFSGKLHPLSFAIIPGSTGVASSGAFRFFGDVRIASRVRGVSDLGHLEALEMNRERGAKDREREGEESYRACSQDKFPKRDAKEKDRINTA